MPRKVFSTSLGAYFGQLRVASGWSQRQAEDIAQRKQLSALNRQTLFRLERGVIKHPSAEVLRAVADLYDVPYEDVVAETVRHTYGSDLPRQTGGADSPVRGDSQHGTDLARLLAEARRAGRREGADAVARLAKAVAAEMLKLRDEAAVTADPEARPRAFRQRRAR